MFIHTGGEEIELTYRAYSQLSKLCLLIPLNEINLKFKIVTCNILRSFQMQMAQAFEHCCIPHNLIHNLPPHL